MSQWTQGVKIVAFFVATVNFINSTLQLPFAINYAHIIIEERAQCTRHETKEKPTTSHSANNHNYIIEQRTRYDLISITDERRERDIETTFCASSDARAMTLDGRVRE